LGTSEIVAATSEISSFRNQCLLPVNSAFGPKAGSSDELNADAIRQSAPVALFGNSRCGRISSLAHRASKLRLNAAAASALSQHSHRDEIVVQMLEAVGTIRGAGAVFTA